MKKLYILNILLIVMAMLMGGCKKKDTSPQHADGLLAGFTIVETANGNYMDTMLFNYSYDTLGRLTQTQYTGQGIVNTTNYTYSTGQVIVIEAADTTIYTLNGLGQAVSDNKGNNYTYDANGYLATKSEPGNYLYTYTTQGGNLTSEVYTHNGSQVSEETYTYLSTPEYRSDGKTFLGKANANLQGSVLIQPGASINFNYTFDSKGRVQTDTRNQWNGLVVYTYTYVN